MTLRVTGPGRVASASAPAPGRRARLRTVRSRQGEGDAMACRRRRRRRRRRDGIIMIRDRRPERSLRGRVGQAGPRGSVGLGEARVRAPPARPTPRARLSVRPSHMRGERASESERERKREEGERESERARARARDRARASASAASLTAESYGLHPVPYTPGDRTAAIGGARRLGVHIQSVYRAMIQLVVRDT